MLSPAGKSSQAGFTLVEILVVTVIMGLTLISIYGTYLSTQKSSVTSEEMIDVQQNLRVAMETMVQDIRMAGFLVSSNLDPIAIAPGVFGIDGNGDDDLSDAEDSGSFFQLRTSSSSKTIARVVSESYSSPTVTLDVEDDMAAQFEAGHKIRVIRSGNKADVTGEWTVTSVDIANDQITVTDAAYVAGTVEEGDMIVRKLVGEAQPTVINYWLRPHVGGGSNNYDLKRNDGSGASIVASNISAVSLAYLDETGAAAATNADIRAVRIDMAAQIDNQLQAFTGLKTRRLQTLVKIRNSLGE